MGTLFYVFGNVVWYGGLLAFFIGSSLLSRMKGGSKRDAERFFEKGVRRDAGQVAANGGLPLIAAVGHAVYPHPAWWYACLGALAAANADTWATEIGTLSRRTRSILNGRRVAPGTSGGVSVAGCLASLAGGCFIGACALGLSLLFGAGPEAVGHERIGFAAAGSSAPVFEPSVSASDSPEAAALKAENTETDRHQVKERTSSYGAAEYGTGTVWIWIGGLCGFLASLVDSLLGATVQAGYRCAVCGRLVEKDRHCGAAAVHVKGWHFFRNDQVNAASILCGSLIGVIMGSWL